MSVANLSRRLDRIREELQRAKSAQNPDERIVRLYEAEVKKLEGELFRLRGWR